MFLCQLTKENTISPVCTKYGTIYDYHSIMQYIQQHHKDPQTQKELNESDLTKIDISYLTSTYTNDFSDDKEKLLSRLLYERDAMIRLVAKVMQDYQTEEQPLKRKKIEPTYSFHDFKEEIEKSNVMKYRKQKNKQLSDFVVNFAQTDVSEFPDLAQHPLKKVTLAVKNKIYLMHNDKAIHEYIAHTKKEPKFVFWHCDLKIFFVVYSTFLDLYSWESGYVNTWHIKHEIIDAKCCANGYLVGIQNSNSQIDIFDLRKINEDSRGFVKSIDVENNSSFGFAKNHNLFVFGQETR
eukprot:NODE_4_length_77007_cov_1.156642.p36 type:complete len:294 gc:universal NODE_4_length_77007_cov_1.156642:31976-32857(+)